MRDHEKFFNTCGDKFIPLLNEETKEVEAAIEARALYAMLEDRLMSSLMEIVTKALAEPYLEAQGYRIVKVDSDGKEVEEEGE